MLVVEWLSAHSGSRRADPQMLAAARLTNIRSLNQYRGPSIKTGAKMKRSIVCIRFNEYLRAATFATAAFFMAMP
ncbi:MAG: hypothetical protein ABI268_06775, partial [Rhodanobacter sp.]